MAKILSIPDIHGSHNWEKVKTITEDSYDYIVFHGDYFDSWENEWPDQGENFRNICAFIREDTTHRKLLLGNHDWAYLSGTRDGSCSGHQHNHSLEIRKLLKENLDIIDLAFNCDEWVFSHAGFSKTWVDSIKNVFHRLLDKYDDETGKVIEPWDEEDFCINFLNSKWHKLTHIPGDENFSYAFDELLDWHGYFSGSGDEITQGPLWIRPESLLQDAYYPKQVVGHTELCIYDKAYLQKNENKVICVDSNNHNVYKVFDTSEEYDFMTVPEFFRFYKRTMLVINNIKSEIHNHENTKTFVETSLKEKFPEEAVELLMHNHFSKFINPETAAKTENKL